MPVRFLSKLHIDSNRLKNMPGSSRHKHTDGQAKTIMPPRPTGAEEYKMWEFAS